MDAALWLTTVDIDRPLPTCATSTPFDTSRIDMPYGVGPTSRFAMAVNVTPLPTDGAVELADSEIEYPLLA